ncbi:hypothetical protein EV44_g2271 [Erysiphe necator]|uniref:Uncharacterized protein n=1 Tax=Uncinula necator TaxID=52586 RepID=A0A0B1P2W4_UNCNE|nr:hypothetical protein EV44_g2271 [Erysiphe necator]
MDFEPDAKLNWRFSASDPKITPSIPLKVSTVLEDFGFKLLWNGYDQSESSPSHGAGVNAQYTLHVWDSQEDSHNPSLQGSHSSSRVLIVFVSTSLSPQHLFSRSPPRLF